jgi:hypothetical protein
MEENYVDPAERVQELRVKAREAMDAAEATAAKWARPPKSFARLDTPGRAHGAAFSLRAVAVHRATGARSLSLLGLGAGRRGRVPATRRQQDGGWSRK